MVYDDLPKMISLTLSNVFPLQGVRPESFAKLTNNDIKEIIDGCTKTRKDQRWVQWITLLGYVTC